ncbi:hypothetical protein CB1_000183002 [Camelus ferus]|nr:hypothetical protein CB1_000183002 [Camelus ferus]
MNHLLPGPWPAGAGGTCSGGGQDLDPGQQSHWVPRTTSRNTGASPCIQDPEMACVRMSLGENRPDPSGPQAACSASAQVPSANSNEAPPCRARAAVNIGILIAVTRVISQISADNYKIHGDPSAFK